MQSLGEHLKADAALAGVQINYGLRNPVPETDAVDLRYGGSPVHDLDDGDRGDARLWLDVQKFLDKADADTQYDTGAAYAQLYALVNAVLASVRKWWTTDEVSGASFNTSVTEIQPDGDQLRDYDIAAARIILNINWITHGG